MIKCAKIERQRRPTIVSWEFDSAEIIMNEAGRVLNDGQMLTKIGNTGFLSKEVKYHNECKRSYRKRAKKISLKQDNSEHWQVSQYALVSLFS